MATLSHYLNTILNLPIKYLSKMMRMMMMMMMVSIVDDEAAAECAVCLSGIGEGEEEEGENGGKELRCNHVFHKRCLERWVENRGRTCPLCRDTLQLFTENGNGNGNGNGREATITFFPFHFGELSYEDNWWLR